MEDTEEPNNGEKKCNSAKTGSFKGKTLNPPNQKQYQYKYHHHHHHHHQVFQYSDQYGLYNHHNHNQNQRYYQEALPLLPLPPNPIPFHLALAPSPLLFPSSLSHNQSLRSKTRLHRPPCRLTNPLAASSETHRSDAPLLPEQALVVTRRPDSGGVEGTVIALLANHFSVQFDPAQKIFHYNVEISPTPSSKYVARLIKQKLVAEYPAALSAAIPAFDGRKNLYSPVEFQHDKLELFVTLPEEEKTRHAKKLFRVNIRLVSKLNGRDLSRYLSTDGEESPPIPQNYLHALDVVLRESSVEKCVAVGRSLYSASMGGSEEIGGGAVGLRGFFQSLRPTKQGLALNVDFSVTAFHESIGVIPYLQKRLAFLRDLPRQKTRGLVAAERREVEKALRNIRVIVCHRETVQRYRVYGLTEEATESLWFKDRDGTKLRLVSYFKDHYNYDIQYRNLPCLEISRSKPCYLPMELCVICEGQKFLGKLSDDQTARIMKMGCQRPKERKAIIDGVMQGPFSPTSGIQGREFKLHISREMTRLKGRVLQPPKLKLGETGRVRNLTPDRSDRQWNLMDSHVLEGTRIERWALISFGGSTEQRSAIPNFVAQLCQRCENLGILLNKQTTIAAQFEPTQVLNNVSLLEAKLKRIQRLTPNNLQLIICVMERRHKGYADLKRIAETSVGVVTQCCLYQNLAKPSSSSQFLANLALKINAKVGGSTVALYSSLNSRFIEPVIFMGADVTHPHPLDDTSPSVAAVVGTVNWPGSNKYASRMRAQTHRQEIILDLGVMVSELLGEFRSAVGLFPAKIVFFRDGVSETQFDRVLREELRAIKAVFSGSVTFAVVQKRHHSRLFPARPDLNSGENIPPGTVVDTVITHPREFDFFLCSHWGVKGTSRPTHYHVLCDESGFTSDELQKLVYDLCFTYARCTKPVSLVPPAYYAHLAAYRGRLYLERSEPTSSGSAVSRVGPMKTMPLPKLTENVRNLFFYC